MVEIDGRAFSDVECFPVQDRLLLVLFDGDKVAGLDGSIGTVPSCGNSGDVTVLKDLEPAGLETVRDVRRAGSGSRFGLHLAHVIDEFCCLGEAVDGLGFRDFSRLRSSIRPGIGGFSPGSARCAAT